jgi:hypothetical protein
MSGTTLPIRISVEGGPQAEATFNAISTSGERAMTRVEQSSQAAGAAGSRFGQIMGQAGFQVQDFASQVAGGQSALLAFGQQASQLLGVFGTGGAIAGAALTVGVLAAQLLGLGKNAEDAGGGVEELARDMQRAVEQAQTLARVLIAVQERFISISEAGRLRTQRDVAEQIATLENEAQGATFQLLNQQRLAQEARDQLAALPSMAPPLDTFDTSGQAPFDPASRAPQLQAQIEAAEQAEREARNRQLRIEFDLNRLRGLQLGLINDGSNPNPGTLDRDPPTGGSARAPAAPGVNRDLQQSIRDFERAQAALNALNQEENLREAGLERAAPALAAYERAMTTLVDALDRGLISQDEFNNRVTTLSERLPEDMDRAAQSAQRAGQASQQFGQILGTAFEDAVLRGRTLEDTFQRLDQALAQLILRQAVFAPLQNALSPLLSAAGSAVTSTVSGFFAPTGARAEGGPVSPGGTYLVGERGPELVTFGAAGNVSPSMGGTSYAPVYNIDARGADDAMLPKIRAIAEAVTQQGLAQFRMSILRGGSDARLVGRR